MLDSTQRKKVVELFEDGVKVSEISDRVGVSRQSVYNVIRDDFKTDRNLIKLEKDLKKTKLMREIHDLRKPLLERQEYGGPAEVMDRLVSRVLALWYMNPKLGKRQFCIYCGNEMELGEYQSHGRTVPAYKCRECDKVFPFP